MFFNCGNDRITSKSHSHNRILVDGPFCSPMENILKSRIAICIAAGIGITPFVSILNYFNGDNVRWQRPYRLHLVWIVRSADQLTWAADLITALHHKCWRANQPDRFHVTLYLTREKSKEGLFQQNFDPLSLYLMENRVHLGRPDWAELFTEWSSLYLKRKVSVFTCGPQSIFTEVKSTARNFNRKQCRFTCTNEAFS